MTGLKVTEEGCELTPDPGFVLRAREVRIAGETEPRLCIRDGEDELELSFSRHSYQLRAPGQPLNLSVESLLRKHVTTIRAFNSGVLHARFEDGVMLVIEPALEYEAWELRRNGEIMMFALPLGAEGGQLAVLR